jgi:hypothetical protein
MNAVVEAPRELIEAIADLRLPPRADRKLQALMDRNNNGLLSREEYADLQTLVELNDKIALLSAKALVVLLGRKPV